MTLLSLNKTFTRHYQSSTHQKHQAQIVYTPEFLKNWLLNWLFLSMLYSKRHLKKENYLTNGKRHRSNQFLRRAEKTYLGIIAQLASPQYLVKYLKPLLEMLYINTCLTTQYYPKTSTASANRGLQSRNY